MIVSPLLDLKAKCQSGPKMVVGLLYPSLSVRLIQEKLSFVSFLTFPRKPLETMSPYLLVESSSAVFALETQKMHHWNLESLSLRAPEKSAS